MLILFSIFFPLVIGSACVLVNGNKISKAKPSGKTILVDNKNYSFEMDMENFISYVLMAQMDESEPEELLKAKSVIIRTYILYKMKDKAQIAASDLGMEYRNYGELKNSRFQDFCRKTFFVLFFPGFLQIQTGTRLSPCISFYFHRLQLCFKKYRIEDTLRFYGSSVKPFTAGHY